MLEYISKLANQTALIATRLRSDTPVNYSLWHLIVLLRIFGYLDEIGLCKASQVCKRWRMLTDDIGNWRALFENKWPLFVPVGDVISWRDLYIKM